MMGRAQTHVSVVKPGGMHPDQDLPGLELGDWPLLLEHRVVEDMSPCLLRLAHDECSGGLGNLNESRHLQSSPDSEYGTNGCGEVIVGKERLGKLSGYSAGTAHPYPGGPVRVAIAYTRHPK